MSLRFGQDSAPPATRLRPLRAVVEDQNADIPRDTETRELRACGAPQVIVDNSQITELRLKRSCGNENARFYSVVEPTIAT